MRLSSVVADALARSGPAATGSPAASDTAFPPCPFDFGGARGAVAERELGREARAAVAHALDRAYVRGTRAEDVVLTPGVPEALHSIFRALLDPGDEVIVPAPCFPETRLYCESYGARLVLAPPRDPALLGSLDAIATALSPKTRIVLLASLGNPAGVAYPRSELEALRRHVAGRTSAGELVVVSDESSLDGSYLAAAPASPWAVLESGIMVGFCPSGHAQGAARAAFLALGPELRSSGLRRALVLSQRILGYGRGWGSTFRPLEATANDALRRKRDALAEVLIGAGLDFILPAAGSSLLARSPIDSELEFTAILARHGIAVLPGTSLGAAGFVCASFAVDDHVIANSSAAWQGAVYDALGLDSVRVPRTPALVSI